MHVVFECLSVKQCWVEETKLNVKFLQIFSVKKMVFAAMLLKKINLFKEQVFGNNAVGVW